MRVNSVCASGSRLDPRSPGHQTACALQAAELQAEQQQAEAKRKERQRIDQMINEAWPEEEAY